MPRIEDINQQVSAGGPADLATVRPNQGFANLGKQAAAADVLLEEIANRDAAMAGASALADFRAARAKRQLELRTQATTPESFTETALADFDEAADKLVLAHDNERVQAFLEARLVDARAGEEIESDAWQANTLIARSEQRTVETVNKFANLVHSNPGQFQSVLADVDAAIDAAGLPLNVADKQRVAARSALARSAVYGQIESDPWGVLKQLQGGQWDQYLDNDAKISAVNAAQGEIKRREAEAKATQAAARQEALFDIEQWSRDNTASLQMTGKPVVSPYTDDQVKAILKPKQYETIKHTHTQAAKLFEANGDMRSQTPAEIQATIDKQKPVEGQQGFADQQAIYTAAQRIRDNTIAARKADPAFAAREAFPNVKLAWQQAEANPTDAGHFRVALKRSLAAQAAMGVPVSQQKAMPDQLARSLAGRITGAKPEEAGEALKEVETMFGPAYWGAAMKQMAPMLDGHMRVAPIIKDPVQAALLISGARAAATSEKGGAGIDALRKSQGVTASGDKSISAIVAGDRRVNSLVTSIVQRNDPLNYATQIPQSIEVLALSRMRTYGESMEAATEAATKTIVEDNYHTGGVGTRPWRIPKTAGDVAQIEAGAQRVQMSVKPENLDLPGDQPGATNTPESYASAVRRNGYWVTNDDETGAILYSERGVPVTVKGKPVEWKWGEFRGKADFDYVIPSAAFN